MLAVCRLVRPGGQICLVGLTNGDTPLSKLASGKPLDSCHVYNVQPPGEQVCKVVVCKQLAYLIDRQFCVWLYAVLYKRFSDQLAETPLMCELMQSWTGGIVSVCVLL